MIDSYLQESLELLRSINNHLERLAILPPPQIVEQAATPAAEDAIPTAEKEADGAQPKVVKPPIVPPVSTTFQTAASVPVANEDKSYAESFGELKELLESDTWPQAVDPDLICHDESEEDKSLRAEGIIEFLIDEDLEGKRFLDFGCGEGHVAKKALEKRPLLAMGYDIHKSEAWDTLGFPADERHGVTDDWQRVAESGPFDVVLIYDVLDHLEGDPVETLKRIKGVLSPGGRIYIRCHPWCSRHATHLYKKTNKAFLHLVFSEVELARLGLSHGLKTHKIIHPHLVYKTWFNDAGLDLINESALRENLEDFFHMNPILNERIKDNWKGVSIDPQLAAGKSWPSYQLQIIFIDFLLKN